MKSPTPPAPPDPVATANAQAASNKQTAIASQQLNMVDQVNPYGSLTYEKTGAYDDGTPKFRATTTFAPAQQDLFNQQQEFDRKTNDIAIRQTDRLGSILGSPVNLNNEATESRLFDLGSRRLNPRFAQEEEALRTRLSNQGIQEGSQAFDASMRNFSEGKNDAFNQLLLSGRGQAVQEALTERNQPINEITALMSGGQVSQPQFASTPSTNVAGTDVAGLTMDAYRYGPLAAWQAKQANNQAMMGGLFGLGGTLGSAAMGYPRFGFGAGRM